MAWLGSFFATIFSLPLYTAGPGFDPTSVEVHQTGTFEGRYSATAKNIHTITNYYDRRFDLIIKVHLALINHRQLGIRDFMLMEES